jgi:phytoene dehydrogenase-like protein
MRLADHGYRVIERPISNFLPQEDGGYLKLGGGLERTQAEFARFSRADADILPAYYDSLEVVADVLRDLAMKSPPNVGDGMKTLIDGALQGRKLAGFRSSGSVTCSTCSPSRHARCSTAGSKARR